ncbi:hypothetical protein HDU84_009753 [Entophlyctis sp. JEL0112]|nr:hypothetical protein HDU84_009753 [Entophlyctis sp. JEL0112]
MDRPPLHALLPLRRLLGLVASVASASPVSPARLPALPPLPHTAVASLAAVGVGVGVAVCVACAPDDASTAAAVADRDPAAAAAAAAAAVGPFSTSSHFVSAAPRLAKCDSAKSHHLRDGSGFANPWPSFRPNDNFLASFAKLMVMGDRMPAIPREADRVPVRGIDWPRIMQLTGDKSDATPAVVDIASDKNPLALTWLGHAAFLLSTRAGSVLLDPCLSDRCSPLSFAGPQRIVRTPCDLGDLDVDVVVISHNHYDHLDLDVLKKLADKKKDIVFFVPLGNKQLLVDAGIEHVVECDWWDSYNLQSRQRPEARLQISCTPSQHFSSRTLWDKNKTLWSSWHIQSQLQEPDTRAPVPAEANNSEDAIATTAITPSSKSFFFGGDTGYRTVTTNNVRDADLDSLPTCPAFRDVREQFGPVDLAALPIGAYAPRSLLSSVHCSPRDAVDVHADLAARKSVAMHWGTFVLSREGVMEPPRLLKEEMQRRGMAQDEFVVVDVGETVVV